MNDAIDRLCVYIHICTCMFLHSKLVRYGQEKIEQGSTEDTVKSSCTRFTIEQTERFTRLDFTH